MARDEAPSFLASRGFSAQRSRARTFPLLNLKKKRDCSQSTQRFVETSVTVSITVLFRKTITRMIMLYLLSNQNIARSNCAESVSIGFWFILKLRSFELSGNVQDACTTLRSIKDIAHKPGVVSHYTFFAFSQIRQNASLLLQDNHKCLDIKGRDGSETVATQINNDNKQKAGPKTFEHNFYFMVSWFEKQTSKRRFSEDGEKDARFSTLLIMLFLIVMILIQQTHT